LKTPLFVLIAWLLSAVPSLAQPVLNDPTLMVTEVVSGLNFPTSMAFIGSNDILVLEKDTGTVRRVLNGVLQPNPVLDVNVDTADIPGVFTVDEQGLLGIAVHPNFSTNHYVYLFFTESGLNQDTQGDSAIGNRVYRYEWDGTNGVLINPTLILDLMARANFDIGGVMTFGPDGKLYVVSGDQSGFGQLQNNLDPFADPPDDTGVIFRLNDDGSPPSDNPFVSQGAPWDSYYAYGIRNSFGMAFDPLTGKLWDTENGDFEYDEINLVNPGFNSGWMPLMGPVSRSLNSVNDLYQITGSAYSDPKFSWLNNVAPSAIVFVKSTQLGSTYQNHALVGDYINGNLYNFRLNTGRNGFVLSGALTDLVADDDTEFSTVLLGTNFNSISDLKMGPDGSLYVVSLFDGKIYKISGGGGGGGGTPPVIGATTLPNGEIGVAYDIDLNISGGTAPYTVTVTSGALPPGLGISSGHISGTPTSGKGGSLTIGVTDQAAGTASRKFKMKLVAALSISTTTLKAGTVGKNYNGSLKVKGGAKPFNWSVVSGTLPSGLSLSSSTGKITGIATSASSGSITFQATDPMGGVVQKALTLTIN
jgi:glucose/arabinose dehydrogenase